MTTEITFFLLKSSEKKGATEHQHWIPGTGTSVCKNRGSNVKVTQL